jgi:hypothetical protein
VNVEIHPADWGIPYPADPDEKSVPGLLRSLTCVEHEVDDFPWHLVSRMTGILEAPEASFEYLHLTAFFRARAAMLALKGNVLDHTELHSVLGKHRVQAGGIYRKHLLRCIRTTIAKHNLGQLPECDLHPLDPANDPNQTEKNRDVIHRVVRATEIDYLKTLNFISVATEMEEEIARHSVEFWVQGAEMPKPLDVRVRVRQHDGGHDLLPAREEVKRLIRAGRPVHKVRVRLQGALQLGMGDRGKTVDHRHQTSDRKGEASRWDVIGDFNVIRMPGVRQEINLSRKHKARAVLRFIHQWVADQGTREFYVEEVRDAFNRQFTGDDRQRCWISDRFREDLFRGKEKEFDLLFESVEKMAGRYRVRGIG